MFDRGVRNSFRALHRALFVVALIAAAPAGSAAANPVLGFIEEWTGTDLHNWVGGSVGGSVDVTNPGTGGRQGAGDGFLLMSRSTVGNLGVYTIGSEYLGYWLAAGIQSVRVWLNDVNTDDPLEIHFVIGHAQVNVWQYNEGFLPPHNGWAEFVVDLTDSTKFTQTFGPGTFDDALRDVDRLHFRHDLAPYMQFPDPIQADVGIDHVELSGVNVPVVPTTWGRLKVRYR